MGKEQRSKVRRRDHAGWDPPSDRRDPLEILRQQEVTRVPELVPIRHGRMLESPFAFFRGAAAVMAADLASTPTTGLRVQLCGDAHLSNFGGFASPDRALVFDVNDFDETLPGPFEWDLKRLVASVEIAARDRGFKARDRRAAVLAAAAAYREAMSTFATMKALEIWYTRLDESAVRPIVAERMGQKELKRLDRTAQKARSKDSMRALERLTHVVDGELRIVSDPPLIVPVEELQEASLDRGAAERVMRHDLDAYCRSLSGASRRLIEQDYRFVHMARKVVGVGSVGTRAWIVLMLGRDTGDPLMLQVKEAEASVLEPYAGKSRYANHGRRVVEGQWLMQAASDIFLGYVNTTGIDGKKRDFYVRQLWDWKRSAEIETMSPRLMEGYVRMCAWTLARAHARSGDPVAITAYIGTSDKFDRALADFADAYADQNERDYAQLVEAVKSGEMEARTGL
jgi:uncharacterized protein (DUF2252 family)